MERSDGPAGAGSRRERRQAAKERETERRRRRQLGHWLRRGTLLVLVAVGLVWLGYSFVTAKRLPPTSMAGHTEELPAGHILRTPMRIEVQKHMLEHADGGGPPGVIINYNCQAYRCPAGMIEHLERIARDYPKLVYLAPFPDMDARIAVTRLGEILVLDEVDEGRIREFITR